MPADCLGVQVDSSDQGSVSDQVSDRGEDSPLSSQVDINSGEIEDGVSGHWEVSPEGGVSLEEDSGLGDKRGSSWGIPRQDSREDRWDSRGHRQGQGGDGAIQVLSAGVVHRVEASSHRESHLEHRQGAPSDWERESRDQHSDNPRDSGSENRESDWGWGDKIDSWPWNHKVHFSAQIDTAFAGEGGPSLEHNWGSQISLPIYGQDSPWISRKAISHSRAHNSRAALSGRSFKAPALHSLQINTSGNTDQ